MTKPNGILCVIGPNGAGKTSLFNVVTGNLPLSSGEIELDGKSIENRPVHCAAANGIGRKMQIPSIFPNLSVRENLILSMLVGRARFVDYFRPTANYWQSEGLSKLLNSSHNPINGFLEEQAGFLSQGHKQFLEFSMVTASEPRIVLLDEPCAGLSPEETKAMTALTKAYQEQSGGLVVVIEHDMSLVESLSDQVMVLHEGKVFASGSYSEIQQNTSVREIYAGGRK